MRASAPGKVVISGAYAVLEGAHAIVSAVSRYVIADTQTAAERATPEVRAALGERPAPGFDASALFDGERKLGLGASAAILVASLAAIELEAKGELSDAMLANGVLAWALEAHAQAQGGGSGVDVAASVHGGTLLVRRSATGAPSALETRPVRLPPLVFEVWAADQPASTPDLLAAVRALADRDRETYSARLRAQHTASEAAAQALLVGDSRGVLSALDAQQRALDALGQAIGRPIVTPEARELADLARLEQATFLPAGAGGGDVSLFVGEKPSSESFRARAAAFRQRLLELELGARGVHAS